MARAFNKTIFIHQKYQQALPKQFIAIANHPSIFEDFGMPFLFPNARFLAKSEVGDWPLAGRLAKAAGVLFVKREDRSSRRAASEKMVASLKDGSSIALFPEGGCKGRRIHLPFLYGAFDTSMQTGIPIIPVFIHYEAQENFEWLNESTLGIIWSILKSRNRRVNYYVHDPIDPKRFNEKDEYCQYVQNLYLQWQDKYLV